MQPSCAALAVILPAKRQMLQIMADKIKRSYRFSKSFYDDAITQGKWWSRVYFKLLWGGVDDNEIARRVLGWIPDDFSGKLLDVPVGTAVFTTEKYKRMKQTDITCLDYSRDMLDRAESRFREAGITNCRIMQGDVGSMPFENNTFDYILCMNGLHVFPDKKKRIRRDLTHVETRRRAACLFLYCRRAEGDRLACPHCDDAHGVVYATIRYSQRCPPSP